MKRTVQLSGFACGACLLALTGCLNPILNQGTEVESLATEPSPATDFGPRPVVPVASCTAPLREIRTKAAASPASSAITLNADGSQLWIAAEDHGELLVVDADTLTLLHRWPVGAGLYHVINVGNGHAVVSLQSEGALAFVDVQTGASKKIAVGSGPTGLTKLPDGRVATTLSGAAAVALVDFVTDAVQTIALTHPNPVAIVLHDDGHLWVAHGMGAVLSKVDYSRGIVRTYSLTDGVVDAFGNDTARQPNLFSSITLFAGRLFFAHSLSETHSVRVPFGGPEGLNAPVQATGTDKAASNDDEHCGYSGCPGEAGAVIGGLTVMASNQTSTVPFLNTRQAALPSGLGVIGVDGATALVVVPHEGTGLAGLYCIDINGQKLPARLRTISVGAGTRDLVVRGDGHRVYLWSRFDRTVTALAFQHEVAGAKRVSAPLIEDALSTDVSLGRRLFHSSVDTDISGGGVSCASCHPEGGADGLTWQFADGLRNTPQLGGGLLQTAPFHWAGTLGDLNALNDESVRGLMGGAGLSARSLRALGAYLDQLSAPLGPAAGRPLDAVELRGRALFESDAVGCLACHAGPQRTDNTNHDVGTMAVLDAQAAFQTPGLQGLARTGPWLHDGSADSLTEVVTRLVVTDQMGHGSDLSPDDVQALVRYLETL